MRLFIGLQPTAEFRTALTDLQMQLQSAGVNGRYLSPSNLHLTLAFIGESSENLTEILPNVADPFSITLSHIGIFTKAKVLWAGIKPSQELNELASDVRRQLDDSDIPYDRQVFNPHITLIRKPLLSDMSVLNSIQVVPATMIVRKVCLYQSVRDTDGMKYTVISSSK